MIFFCSKQCVYPLGAVSSTYLSHCACARRRKICIETHTKCMGTLPRRVLNYPLAPVYVPWAPFKERFGKTPRAIETDPSVEYAGSSKTSGHYDVHSADPRVTGGRAVTSFSFPCVSVPVFSMNGGGVGFKIVRDDDIVEDGPGSIETAVCIAPDPPPCVPPPPLGFSGEGKSPDRQTPKNRS